MLIVPAVIGYLVAFFQIIREPASTSPAHPPDFNPVPAALPNVLYPSIQDSNKDTTPLLQNTAGKINCYYFNNPEPLTHRTLIRSRLRYPMCSTCLYRTVIKTQSHYYKILPVRSTVLSTVGQLAHHSTTQKNFFFNLGNSLQLKKKTA